MENVFKDNTKDTNNCFSNNLKKAIVSGAIVISSCFTPTQANDIQQSNNQTIEFNQNEKSFEISKLLSMSMYGEYLPDQLKLIIINDQYNFISQKDKDIYSNYISNQNDKKSHDLALKTFTNFVENFNKNNENNYFSTSFIRNTYGESEFYDKFFVKSRSILDSNYLFKDFNSNWVGNKTIESQYQTLKDSQLTSLETDSVYKNLNKLTEKQKDFILSDNNENYEKFNQLLNDNLNLLYKSLQKDIETNIITRGNSYSKNNYDFIKQDLNKLSFISNSLIEPKQNLLNKEYESLSKIVNTNFTNKDNVLLNLKVFESEIVNLKSFRNNEKLFEEYKNIFNSNTNDFKTKYDSFIIKFNEYYSNNELFKNKYDYNNILEKTSKFEKNNEIENKDNNDTNILSLNDKY